MSCCCCCCGGQSRYASADGVFERATDLLVCLISSVAANMLTGVFLHLSLLSSCFLWGQSHFVFLVSCFRSSSFFFSRAVCFSLSTFLFISCGNASYHCHIIRFHPSGVWCSYLGGCKSSSNQQKYLLEPMLAEFSVRISLSGNCETGKKSPAAIQLICCKQQSNPWIWPLPRNLQRLFWKESSCNAAVFPNCSQNKGWFCEADSEGRKISAATFGGRYFLSWCQCVDVRWTCGPVLWKVMLF